MSRNAPVFSLVLFVALAACGGTQTRSEVVKPTTAHDDAKPNSVFVKDASAPADIQTLSGYVIGGRVHAHIVLSNPDHSFGGHLEPETRVFTFAVVTLGVLREPLDLGRIDDKTYR
jgi:predicted DNA-binding protein with PD1-like motif